MARSNMGCHRYTCRRKINTFWNNNNKMISACSSTNTTCPNEKIMSYSRYPTFRMQLSGQNWRPASIFVGNGAAAVCFFPGSRKASNRKLFGKNKRLFIDSLDTIKPSGIASWSQLHCIAQLFSLGPCSLARPRVWPTKLKRDGIRVKHFTLGWALFDFK